MKLLEEKCKKFPMFKLKHVHIARNTKSSLIHHVMWHKTVSTALEINIFNNQQLQHEREPPIRLFGFVCDL